VRTWDSNRETINDLWPVVEFRAEERKLWHDDLSSLDQDLLYDALRNVKRQRESPWPQLAWVLSAYRELDAARRAITKRTKIETGPKLKLDITDEEDARLADEFTFVIDKATPTEFENIRHMILEKLDRLKSLTASRLIQYARRRLLGQEPVSGRIDRAGVLAPLASSGVSQADKQRALDEMHQHRSRKAS
jgi:hypothetical protein